MKLLACLVAGLLAGSASAHAQSAEGRAAGSASATLPAANGGALTKPNNTGVPVIRNRQVASRMPKLVIETDAAYKAEMRRDDHNMNICLGCD